MPHSYIFVVLLLLNALAFEGNADESTYPTFARCNDLLMASIRAFWGITGAPHGVLETFEPGDRYYVIHTSYDYMNTYTKCAYLENFGSVINITLNQKDNAPAKVLSYSVMEEPDGTIIGVPTGIKSSELRRFKWFTVFRGMGIVINYVCTDVPGSDQLPLTVFWVSKKSYSSLPIKTTIDSIFDLMESWGFNFTYDYQHCFSTGSELGGMPDTLSNLNNMF